MTARTAASTTTVRRFVDVEDLICPGCGEYVVGEAPAFGPVHDDAPAAQFSHPDGTALCRTGSGRVAEPVEVPR
jgi:hypothetical protein